MEYHVLTKSLYLPQLEKKLQFEIIPIPDTFRDKDVQDGYASSSEYGLMTHDDDNALGHAFMILDRIRHKSYSRGSHSLLMDDFQNLLLCYSYGMPVRKKETEALISSMLAVKGCARPLANSILSYYESYRKDMAEEYINRDYRAESYALDFVNLYIKAADKALFLHQDPELAMQFYHLAGLYWGDPDNFTFQSTAGKWQLVERRFTGILHNSGKWSQSNESVADDVQLALDQVTKALESGDDNARIVELANEGFAAYDKALEKARNDRQLLRTLVITAWALKKFSLLPALCCLKEESPETIKALVRNVEAAVQTMSLPDAPTYPLRKYKAAHAYRGICPTKDLLCLACTVDIARKLQDALRITKPGQDMAYYTSLDTLMYMLPARCEHKRDAGKLSVMNLAYMNDPNEGRILKKYLLSGRNSGNCDTRKDAAYPFVFIKCFTSRIDDLPMWEIYGDHAQGVCIVIDWPKTLNTAAQAIPLYRVCYLTKLGDTYSLDDDANQQLEHREKIREWLEKLRTIRLELTYDETSRFFDSLLEGIAYLFKDSSYHYEQEVRILYTFSEASDQFRHTSGEYPLLFVQSEFPVAIREIVIGPKFPELARRMPYIQEQIEHMCRINDTPCPKLTLSDIDYK